MRWSSLCILLPLSSSPHLVAGSSLEAQQQVENIQMPPRMESREALQPKYRAEPSSYLEEWKR